MLEDVTTLYDDRVALERTLAVLPEATKTTRREIEDALIRNEERLRVVLRLMPGEQRDVLLEELDERYRRSGLREGVFEYIEGLL